MGKALTAAASVRTTSRSPQREALAEAVARHTTAARLVPAIKGEFAAADEAVYDAQDAVERTSPAVAEAQANAGRHRVAVALGAAGPAPQSVSDARAAAQEALDAHAAALAARAALDEQHAAAAGDLQLARLVLERRVREVIAAEANIERLVADFVALHRELVGRRRVLEWLDLQDAVPRGTAWRSEDGWPDLPGAAPWKAAAAALETDPDAPLPT